MTDRHWLRVTAFIGGNKYRKHNFLLVDGQASLVDADGNVVASGEVARMKSPATRKYVFTMTDSTVWTIDKARCNCHKS